MSSSCQEDQALFPESPQVLASLAGSLCDAAFDPSVEQYQGSVCCDAAALVNVTAGLRTLTSTTAQALPARPAAPGPPPR